MLFMVLHTACSSTPRSADESWADSEATDEQNATICDVTYDDFRESTSEVKAAVSALETEGSNPVTIDFQEYWELYKGVWKWVWAVEQDLFLVDDFCVFDNQQEWDRLKEDMRNANRELTSELRELCPSMFMPLFDDSPTKCEELHSVWTWVEPAE